MQLLRRILSRPAAPSGGSDAAAEDRYAPDAPIQFQDVFRALDAPDADQRYEAAALVSALAPPAAIRPLMRAYVHHGDAFLLDALAVYGERLTIAVGREAVHTTRGPTERARLMDILGASGDAGAIPLVRRAVGDLDPSVHVAASAALVRLGDATGVEHLARELFSLDAVRRLRALRVSLSLESEALQAALEAHLGRYLAEGGAVPAFVSVSLPMLLDRDAELPALIARNARRSSHALTVVIGPEAARLAETRRDDFCAELPEHELHFATDRHSLPEQCEVLMRARRAAAEDPGRRVAFVGHLPSPEGTLPPPHFLARSGGPPSGVGVVFVGQQEFAVVTEWWRYIADRAEVPTDMSVLLTALTYGAEEMSEEELLLCRIAGEDRADAFARALLAHRTTV